MSYWMDKGVLSMQGLIGCFAMTEMRGVSPGQIGSPELSQVPTDSPRSGLERRRSRDDGDI